MKLPLWRLTWLRRCLFEALGSRRFSRPAYANMQEVLLNRLGQGGFFVEAGAVDGFFESNTYFLERFHNWRGILVEPIPEMYRRIATNRPKATAFNCALVPFGFPDTHVKIESRHAMSHVLAESDSLESGGENYVTVNARTLNSLLEEVAAPKVDLLSLDVEGFEIAVLKGLDFDKYAPSHILLECLTEASAKLAVEFLSRYKMVEKLTHRDYLFQLI